MQLCVHKNFPKEIKKVSIKIISVIIIYFFAKEICNALKYYRCQNSETKGRTIIL